MPNARRKQRPDAVGLWHFVAAALVVLGAASCRHPSTRGPSADDLRWSGYQEQRRAGQIDTALKGLGALCRQQKPYARACYDSSLLLLELGRAPEARQEAFDFAVRFPSHALAASAVELLARSYIDEAQPAAGIDELMHLEASVGNRALLDTVFYERAKLHRVLGQDLEEAADLHKLIGSYGRWSSQLWDDAVWRLVAIASSRGDAPAKQRLLELMIATRESSSIGLGSYNSPYLDDALLELGRMYVIRGQLDKAKQLFDDLAGTETSRLRDDALLELAQLEAGRGNLSRACQHLSLLLTIEDASAARHAREQFTALKCR